MRNHPTTIRVAEHIDRLREKPHHVRESITMLVSGGITLLVFLGWLAAFASSNTLALSPVPKSNDIPSPLAKAKETTDSVSSLLGAAGAAAGVSASSPQIHIVDTSPQLDSNQNNTDQTVIHF